MSSKRDKPYCFYSLPKRRRPLPPPPPDDSPEYSSDKSPSKVVVIGLPPHCSLQDIKSQFQIYGSISCTTIHHSDITFRSKAFAKSAVAAFLDPSFGIC